MAQDQGYIDGLLHERAGYARAGRKRRVAQVDAELKRLGYAPEPIQVEGGPVTPSDPPKRRAPRGKQSAAQSAPTVNAEDRPSTASSVEAAAAEGAGDGSPVAE